MRNTNDKKIILLLSFLFTLYSCGGDITIDNMDDENDLDDEVVQDPDKNFVPDGYIKYWEDHFEGTNINTDNLKLKSEINDVEAQSGNTKDRILKDNELISLISSIMTLMPGDIIFTGTPARATEAIVVYINLYYQLMFLLKDLLI